MDSRIEAEGVQTGLSEAPPLLTDRNYRKGFLVDDELMAGVSQDPDQPELFLAFILRHTTGEYLGCQSYIDLPSALLAVNQIPRHWVYEKVGGCGGCGEKGSCSGGACGRGKCGGGSC